MINVKGTLEFRKANPTPTLTPDSLIMVQPRLSRFIIDTSSVSCKWEMGSGGRTLSSFANFRLSPLNTHNMGHNYNGPSANRWSTKFSFVLRSLGVLEIGYLQFIGSFENHLLFVYK